MKYTSFEIENYKGIKKLTIDLTSKPDSKIYTFVGLNESGKTTILEAINTINEGFQKGNEHSLIPKSQKANFTENVSVEATIDVDEEDNNRISEYVKTLGYEYWKPIDSFSIMSCCEFKNSTLEKRMNYWWITIKVKKIKKERKLITIDDSENPHWQSIVKYIGDHLIPRIIYFENFLFKFPEKIILNGDNSEKKENKDYKLVFEDILREVIPNGSIEESIVKKYLATDSGNRDIFHAITIQLQKKITDEVFSSWGQLFDTKDYKPEILLHFGVNKVVSKEAVKEEVYVEIKIKENDELFYISERSLGFQWFFAFLFFTLFRINRKTDWGETIFMFDEPASNLHSSAQKRLLQTFERFVKDKKKSVKLLYTTHSHHLINPKWLEGTFIVKNNAVNYKNVMSNSSEETDISAYLYKHFASQHPNQTDYFQPILDALDYQPGLLEKIPNIIVTEGKFDYYILRYFNEIIFGNKYKKVRLYPGAGCNRNFQIISLYVGWSKDFLILLDGDKPGQKAKQEYLKEFETLVNGKIATYEDLVPEIGSAMIEDIFSEQEKTEITKLFDENLKTYKKSAFNTAIQAALLNGNKIDLSAETIGKFEKLLSKLNVYKFN